MGSKFIVRGRAPWTSGMCEVDEEDVTHTCAPSPPPTTRKKETLPFAITRMSLEGVTLCEISLTEKYKYCVVSFVIGV